MFAFPALLATFGGVLYVLGAIVVSVIALLIIGIVLIQDSKEGGLGGAFGSGMGSEMLGARGQKDIARATSILGAIFAVLVVALGAADSSCAKEARLRTGDEETIRSLPEETAGGAGAGHRARRWRRRGRRPASRSAPIVPCRSRRVPAAPSSPRRPGCRSPRPARGAGSGARRG